MLLERRGGRRRGTKKGIDGFSQKKHQILEPDLRPNNNGERRWSIDRQTIPMGGEGGATQKGKGGERKKNGKGKSSDHGSLKAKETPLDFPQEKVGREFPQNYKTIGNCGPGKEKKRSSRFQQRMQIHPSQGFDRGEFLKKKKKKTQT